MKIKIGNQIIDSNYEPILLILDNQDKINIKNMTPEATKYCSFPNGYSTEVIKEFMKIDKVFNPISITLSSNQTPKHAEITYSGTLDEEQAINFALQQYPFLEGIVIFNMPQFNINSNLNSGIIIIQ